MAVGASVVVSVTKAAIGSLLVVLVMKYTVKPALSGHSKIDKTNVLKTKGSLMKVASIAECSIGAFCNTFDLH